MSALSVIGVLAGQALIAFMWFWVGYSHRQREERELQATVRYLEAVRRVSQAEVSRAN